MNELLASLCGTLVVRVIKLGCFVFAWCLESIVVKVKAQCSYSNKYVESYANGAVPFPHGAVPVTNGIELRGAVPQRRGAVH